jgi:hypothetical protein
MVSSAFFVPFDLDTSCIGSIAIEQDHDSQNIYSELDIIATGRVAKVANILPD